MITALETKYAGCRFRSRMEARWAVLFDAYGVRWRYEPEAFSVNGRAYLPDFHLPEWDCFAEVKGEEQTDEERKLYRDLRDESGKPVLLIEGSPGDERLTLFCWDLSDSSGGSSEWNAEFIGTWDHPPALRVRITEDVSPQKEFCRGDWNSLNFLEMNQGDTPPEWGYIRAREARFGVFE